MKTAPQQSRLKIIPWDVIKANEAAGAIDLTQNENEDDIFSLDETEQQELPTLALPDPLREKLFTHQHYGVNWMFNLFNQNEKGGIIADDMGLGKTLQVTSFLAGTMMADRLHTSLVLTPKSVIPSWERELNNNLKAHLPEVQVVVIDANMKKKQRSTLLGAVEVSNRRSKHIIIMSHHLLLTMIEEVEKICWDCVVLDEGHIIKNTTTKMSQTMHQLRSPFRLLLSGTPIQNDLKEFWALVNWATQGSRFGREADFRKTFADPILRGQDPSAGERSRALAAEARLSLIRVIRPVLLRRKKADQRQKELQLPEKKELVLWIRLSTKQRQQYYEYVHSRRYEEVMRQATYPVEVINTLKTICRHPILLRADQHKDVDELDTAMQRLGLGDAADEAPSQSHGKGHFFDVLGRVPTKDELLSQSTKLRVLARMTSRLLNEDHRVLIFSQSKRMLDIIQFLFVDYGYPTFKIDGSTSSEERQNIIDEFNTPGDEYCGPKICLLTTKACGVGINLVGADRVIIFDPSWNPAEDSQAVDRAYRIGQTKPVIVYRLIHSSCVEEKVYQKQVFKEGLRVISEKGNETKRYFAEKSQLRELLALGGKDAVDILRQVPNKMDLLQLDSLFGMDSVIGCTRHDRLYKEDDAPAAVVEADARSCREEALQGRYPVPQPIAAHAMAQQAKRAAAPTKKATPEPPLHFDEVCEDDNRHPTVDLCDASDVESLASTSGALRGRVNAASCIDLTQSERRGGANSQRSSDASDRSAVSLRSTGSQRSAASQRSTASRSAARRRRFDLDDDDDDAVPSNGDAAAKTKRIVVDDDDDAEFDAAPAPLPRAAAPTDDADDNIDDGDEIDALAAALGDVRVDDGDTVAFADAAGPSKGGDSRRVSALTNDGADSDGDETVALVEPDADATADDDEAAADDDEAAADDDEAAADDDEAAADDDEAAADDDEAAADDDEAAADDDEASTSFVDDAADGGLDETEADVVFEAIDDADDDADDDAGDSAAAERAVLGNHVIPLGVAPVWAPVAGEEVDPYDDDYDEGDDEGDDEDDAAFNLVAFRSTSTAASAAADASPSSKAAGVGQPPAIGFVSLLSMKELRQLRQQPSASQSEPEPAAATASSSQPTDRSAASQSPADGDRSQPASMGSTAEAASSVDVAVGRAPAPRHTPGLLHQYCNVSLFSPSSTVNSSGVDLSALDASHFDAGDSRRSSTASVAEQAPAAVAAATVAAADPPLRTPLRPAADQFRRSLCDHKRRQLYQQLQQTPLRTPQRPAGSGYLSRIKVIGSSMKTPAAAARPAPPTTATTPHGDGRLAAGLSSGFVDGSFMDSDYDDASGRSSDADRLSPLDKENAPNCRRSSSSTAAASVGKAARARAFSHEASCEIAAELARLVEATHEHAADEEQRRYDEESDERRRGGDSPSTSSRQ